MCISCDSTSLLYAFKKEKEKEKSGNLEIHPLEEDHIHDILYML